MRTISAGGIVPGARSERRAAHWDGVDVNGGRRRGTYYTNLRQAGLSRRRDWPLFNGSIYSGIAGAALSFALIDGNFHECDGGEAIRRTRISDPQEFRSGRLARITWQPFLFRAGRLPPPGPVAQPTESTSAPNHRTGSPPSAFAKQTFQLVHKFLHIFEIRIDGSEAHVGNFVELFEA